MEAHGNSAMVGNAGAIQADLDLLGRELRLPDAALKACVARFEEAAPTFRALLARGADGELLSKDEALLLLRGLFVLAAGRDETSCRPLMLLLRRPSEDTEELLGDAIAGS